MLGLLEKKKENVKTFATGGTVTAGSMNWPVSSVTWQDAPATFSQDYLNYVKAVQQSYVAGTWDVVNLAPPQQQRNPMPAKLGEELTTLFERAIELLQDHGWVQGSYYMPGAGFCLLGALQYALTGRLPLQYSALGISSSTTLNAARMVLGELIYQDTVGTNPTRDIPSWNDRHGRTKEDVILLLKHGIERVAENFQ